MKKMIVFIMGVMILMALASKRNGKAMFCELNNDRGSQIRELELRKAEEVHRYYKERWEALQKIHPPQNKDLMEAEMKMNLSRIDVEIARLMCE